MDGVELPAFWLTEECTNQLRHRKAYCDVIYDNDDKYGQSRKYKIYYCDNPASNDTNNCSTHAHTQSSADSTYPHACPQGKGESIRDA